MQSPPPPPLRRNGDNTRGERKGLYVQSTQIGYTRTSKAWKKEEKGETIGE